MSISLATKTYAGDSASLNTSIMAFAPWVRAGAVVKLVDRKPANIPKGTPAWYTLDKGDIFVYVPDLIDTAHQVSSLGGGGMTSDYYAFHKAVGTYARTPAAVAHSIGALEEEFRGKHLTTDVNVDAMRVIGAVQHEAAHSAYSGWMISAQKTLVNAKHRLLSVVTMFEELRIENRIIARDHSDGLFIRTLVGWLLRSIDADVIATAPGPSLAHCWGLTVGRALTGKIFYDEVKMIDAVTRTAFADDVVDQLEILVKKAVEVKTNNPTRCADELLVLAQKWVDLVGSSPATEMLIAPEIMPSSHEIEAGYDEDENEDGGSAPSVNLDARDGEEDEKDTADKEIEAADGRDDESDARSDDLADADEVKRVFIDERRREDSSDITKAEGAEGGEDTGVDRTTEDTFRGHGYSDRVADSFSKVSIDVELIKTALESSSSKMSCKPAPRSILKNPQQAFHDTFRACNTRSTQISWDERIPTSEDRQAAVKAARALDRFSLPSVQRRVQLDELPPGRLDMRQAIRKSADRTAGRASVAKPWKRSKLLRDEFKPTTVGIMTDVSGSMKWAQNESAQFAYAFAVGGARINATTAAVTFGSVVEPVTAPRQIPTKVRIRSADDGSEAFDGAAAALDGALNLTNDTRAVRVVLIVSDGQLVAPLETDKAAIWVNRWAQAGVHVVWVGYTKYSELTDVFMEMYGKELSDVIELDFSRSGKTSLTDIVVDRLGGGAYKKDSE